MTSPSFLQELAIGARHLVLPGLCEGCRRPLIRRERVLCLHCTAALPRTDFHSDGANEAALRLAGRIPFQQATAFSFFRSGGLMQHLLHRLKYGGKKEVGLFLGKQVGHALAAAGWGREADLIVPVPLHPRKEAKRGFNQSAVIAQGLGEALGKPLCADALLRKKNTASQTSKSREERVLNVRDAFYLAPKRSSISGRHLLLIDDVLTTGATLEAAAATVLSEPGVKVSVLVMAIAM